MSTFKASQNSDRLTMLHSLFFKDLCDPVLNSISLFFCLFSDLLDDNSSEVINFKIAAEDCLGRKKGQVESEHRFA